MQQLHITDPDGGSTGIPFWAGIPTEYQPRMEFLTGVCVYETEFETSLYSGLNVYNPNDILLQNCKI